MDEIKTLGEIRKYQGYFIFKLIGQENSVFKLLLKRKAEDFDSSISIDFKGTLSFHDTGIVGSYVEYIDVGLLGYANNKLAESLGYNHYDFRQVVLMSNNKGTQKELIIACKEVALFSKVEK